MEKLFRYGAPELKFQRNFTPDQIVDRSGLRSPGLRKGVCLGLARNCAKNEVTDVGQPVNHTLEGYRAFHPDPLPPALSWTSPLASAQFLKNGAWETRARNYLPP